MKSNYSEPKIFTGGIDQSKWSKLSKTAQKEALKKEWYVYFSFRDPKTGKLKRQSAIKGGANRFHNKKDRYTFLRTLQRNLSMLLQAGFSPYEDNTELMERFMNGANKNASIPPQKSLKREEAVMRENKLEEESVKTIMQPSPEPALEKNTGCTVKEAFELALKIKKKTLNENSYPKYKSPIIRFQKWLDKKGITHIESVTKKIIVEYLNLVLENTSSRTRNNTRTNLSSIFTTLVNNDIIKKNFILQINILKSVPERHKTFTPIQIEKINTHLDVNDPVLKLFIQFISYNFLRPIEVCRLKVKDLDISDKKIFVRAKNKPVKMKIIPEILLKELPDLSKMDPNFDLFTPTGIGGIWDINETDKRNYFSKRFKKVKDAFDLGQNYGLYSFRHTHTTIVYTELVKTMTPLEAKSRLMLITGHATLKALEAYLRDIDAVLPEDYSYLFKNH